MKTCNFGGMAIYAFDQMDIQADYRLSVVLNLHIPEIAAGSSKSGWLTFWLPQDLDTRESFAGKWQGCQVEKSLPA